MCLECLALSKNNVMPGRRERPDDDNAGEGEGRLSGSLRFPRIYKETCLENFGFLNSVQGATRYSWFQKLQVKLPLENSTVPSPLVQARPW